MDVWLIYIIKELLLPPASLLFISFYGVFYTQKNNGKGSLILIGSLVAIFLLSQPLVANFLGNAQQKYSELDLSSLATLDPQAIVVLCGGVKKFSPEYGEGATVNSHSLLRARYAATLAKKIKLPVLVSGGSVFDKAGEKEADILSSVLKNEFNVPVRWLETQSRNTAENAKFSQQILVKEKIKRLILVTNAIHMSRAVKQFESVGLTVIPAPTALFPDSARLSIFSFIPSARALALSSMTIHEWLGEKWYELRY